MLPFFDLLYDTGGWSTVEHTLEDTWTDDNIPQDGTHLIYEWDSRSAQSSTPSNWTVSVNDDIVSTDSHFQRAVGQDGASAFTEGTSAAGPQNAGNTSPTDYYSMHRLIFPFYTRPLRQRPYLGVGAVELAATSQQFLLVAQKRQGAAVTGDIRDAVRKVMTRHPLFQNQGTARRKIIYR